MVPLKLAAIDENSDFLDFWRRRFDTGSKRPAGTIGTVGTIASGAGTIPSGAGTIP